ncbi:MAG: hypothetical protein DMG06_23955 [Acidobacteria bacterium]|nr:MAG: hypothetical protein DMG06_23955 [Acidobacteriota bacterium]
MIFTQPWLRCFGLPRGASDFHPLPPLARFIRKGVFQTVQCPIPHPQKKGGLCNFEHSYLPTAINNEAFGQRQLLLL